MSDGRPPDDGDGLIGLAALLDEDVEWQRLLGKVRRSIERRELSGQAVELGCEALTSVLVEYLKAVTTTTPVPGGRRRAH